MNQTNKVFYTLVAIFLSCSIEMAGQVQKVISGTVTELFGKTAEPLVGVNVNLVNNQNRSLGGGITNLNGQYNVKSQRERKIDNCLFLYRNENKAYKVYRANSAQCDFGVRINGGG